MVQFLEIKAANPDSLLWYRMGDFYELFFEDAVVAAQALGIVLTKRGKHLGSDIPMCGVPVHRADEHLQRLIRLGYRVAVCEQLEDPADARKRGSKAVVRRDVVRLVTAGTITEDSLLDARTRNYLTAVFRVPAAASESTRMFALASLDISTGEFEVGDTTSCDLAGELMRLAPAEMIVADAAADAAAAELARSAGAALTTVASAFFDSAAGERRLKERLGVAELGGFGAFSRAELAAVGALLRYVDLTQIGARPVVRPPRRAGACDTLVIDAASRVNLELLRSGSGSRDGSLLAAIDRTVTGPGARELASRLASPLRGTRIVAARLDAVAFLAEREPLRTDIRASLRAAPDLARALSRLALHRGGPRDLAAIRDGLRLADACGACLSAAAAGGLGLGDELRAIQTRLAGLPPELGRTLHEALVDEPPVLRRDGGFVRAGYRSDLDAALALANDSRRVIAELETRYVDDTGIKSLKVRHNNILGFFIEVTAANAGALLESGREAVFRHRQTMANAVRFTTRELEEIEGRIASASERALAIEQAVFGDLVGEIVRSEQALSSVAEALAELDVHAGLAELAAEENYVRPTLDNSTAFEIRGGRHPVVEQALRKSAGTFVENDCVLGRNEPMAGAGSFEEAAQGRIWLLTGPNMAGKSTFLRQNALILILAQMGSFVPARSAHIGVADRLFCRVGASDDLARGRSTFMVEMVETAAILNQATARSLVILDEIGRGTATFDGLSIAWATVEHLHAVNGCRTLFATHYHELTALSTRLSDVANATIEVKEWQDRIVFLHQVRPGAADRSYGIQVAKLAGLPQRVIERAGEVLAILEKTDRNASGGAPALDELPLFAAARPTSRVPARAAPSSVEREIDRINADELSPKAALETLYRLKTLRRQDKEEN